MQRDFHYDLTKCLAVLAGFTKPQARTIAWANYMTDCTRYTQLKWHSLGNPGPYFHFVEHEGKVKPDSPIVNEYLDEITKGGFQLLYPKRLIRLGMALHTYQDTWAHQGWTGHFHRDNVVKLGKGFWFIPPYGHSQLYKIPDRVEKCWTQGLEPVNNWQRFHGALACTYNWLCKYIGSNSASLAPAIDVLSNICEYDERKRQWSKLAGMPEHFSDIKGDMYATYKDEFKKAAKLQRIWLINHK